ncbi:hypothetical protein ACODT5_10310 [Streptomyces sp. 5.8]|uniref:hypothetical protein n=1 Tax=Streptomyces sp. 5.8 TaxID=3406571 RepID=UPI003BB607BB
MTGTRPGPRGTELRLALAMRGGVSLAVWMGGACCEVSKLREAAPSAPGARARRRTPACATPGTQAEPRSRPPGDDGGATTGPGCPDVYRTLLDAGGYRTVDIDVLSGTSAGGLNGVLLACHLVYGMPFDHGVRDVWLHLGDLEDLLRRPALLDVPNALMRGDEVFYGGLRAALEALVPPPDSAFRPASSLRLILTATRLRPRTDWVRPTLGEPLLVGRSNAYFHVRHRGGLTDFPDGEARAQALDRLATPPAPPPPPSRWPSSRAAASSATAHRSGRRRSPGWTCAGSAARAAIPTATWAAAPSSSTAASSTTSPSPGRSGPSPESR